MTHKHLTVQKLLRRYPAAIKAFIQYNTTCIGCAFERFCTLEDVSRHYKIPLPELEQTIQDFIHNTDP